MDNDRSVILLNHVREDSRHGRRQAGIAVREHGSIGTLRPLSRVGRVDGILDIHPIEIDRGLRLLV